MYYIKEEHKHNNLHKTLTKTLMFAIVKFMSRNTTREVKQEDRHLRVVPDAKRPRYGVRRTVAALMGVATLGALGAGFNKGLDLAEHLAKKHDRKIADAAPKAGEICLNLGNLEDQSAIRTARQFAEEINVAPMAMELGIVTANDHEDGVSVCRPKNASGLGVNHVVATRNVDQDASVDRQEFQAAGGVAPDSMDG